MKLGDIPVVMIGPGSQPQEEDGAQLEYISMPSDMATSDDESIEEERRLFYVAITRAKDRLYVLFPLRYWKARG